MKALFLALSACLILWSEAAWAQCSGDADCRGGRVCREGACVEAAAAACGKDTDCPEPMLCVEQRCQAPAPSPSPTPSAAPTSPTTNREIVYAERTAHGIPEMWIPSLVVFTLSWGATIGITAGISGEGENIAYSTIPVFGPFILLGVSTDDYIAPLIISGVVQTASLGLFITGLVLTKTERVPVGVALSDDPNPTRLVLLPGPVGTADSFGLTASLLDF